MNDLNNYILLKAKQAGVCQDGADQLARANSVDDLLAMYVRHIDFCLEKNFPGKEDLLRLASDQLKAYGIHIDSYVDLSSPEFAVLLGKCTGSIASEGYAVSQLFLKDNTSVLVNTADNAFLVVDCFDQSDLQLVASDESKVLVNLYGSAKVNDVALDNARIKIVHKQKATY